MYYNFNNKNVRYGVKPGLVNTLQLVVYTFVIERKSLEASDIVPAKPTKGTKLLWLAL